MRLLVADDHPGYRLLVRTALADVHDLEVVGEVAHVDEVRAVAVATAPDAALVDLLLPGGGGFSAAEALQEVVPGAAAIVSSAHTMDELDMTGHRGGIGFLSKGVSPFRLADEIVDLVSVLLRSEPPLDEVSAVLPQERASSAAARALVTEALERWGCTEQIETAKLLVSELVSNAILHAGSEVEVCVQLRPDRVRFEISDRSEKQMRRRQAGEDDTSGRGSELIDLLARAWGMNGRADGKCIWFELDR